MATPAQVVARAKRAGQDFTAPKRRRGRRRTKRPPRITFPTRQRNRFARELLAYLADAQAVVDEVFTEAALKRIEKDLPDKDEGERSDADEVGVADLMDKVRVRWAQKSKDPRRLKRIAEIHARSVDGHVRGYLTRSFSEVIGIDIKAELARDRGAVKKARKFVTDSVGLIETIPAKHFDKIEELVNESVLRGGRAEDMQKVIQARFGVSKSRATLIAVDQTNKWHGRIQEHRQRATGMTRYRWRTVGDERVRGLKESDRTDHAILNGTLQTWKNPPDVGDGRHLHPGQDFRCRCQAEPDFEGWLSALKAA